MRVFTACFIVLTFLSVTFSNAEIKFSSNITKDSLSGWDVVELKAVDTVNPAKNLSAKIVPKGGCNLISFKTGNQELIYGPKELKDLLKSCIGTPVLYPTPNRIKDAVYVFMADTLKMSFPGETRSHLCHGIAWDDTMWDFKAPVASTDSVSFSAYYRLDEKSIRFPAYPFKNTLEVRFTLFKDRIRIAYNVINQDKKPMGFGFGLHPFWNVIGNKEDNFIQADLPYHMEATKMFPSGKIEPVNGSKWSLLEPVPVSGLQLDDVYFGATPKSNVRVIYKKEGIEIRQEATKDFTHVVVYTPNTNFFCVENQTCSTDAHNLYAQGLKKESHLQILKPGEKASGFVDYRIIRK